MQCSQPWSENMSCSEIKKKDLEWQPSVRKNVSLGTEGRDPFRAIE